MSFVVNRYPDKLVEFVTCADVSSLSVQRHGYKRKINLGCATYEKVYTIFANELKKFHEAYNQNPSAETDQLLIYGYDDELRVMTSKWVISNFTGRLPARGEYDNLIVFLGSTHVSVNNR